MIARRAPKLRLTPSDVARFLVKLDMSAGLTACWLWVGAVTGPSKARKTGGASGQRGNFRVGGRMWKAHRVAFTIANGREPKGIIRHECDNRLCCNPKHLLDGTLSQNLKDAYERGRRGER